MKLDWDRDYPKFLIAFFVILASVAIYAVPFSDVKDGAITLAKVALQFGVIVLVYARIVRIVLHTARLSSLLKRSRVFAFLFILCSGLGAFELAAWLDGFLFGFKPHQLQLGSWIMVVAFAVIFAVLWKPAETEETNPASTNEITAK